MKSVIIPLMLVVSLLFVFSQTANAALEPSIIADSAADFSDVQGQDNWHYGYCDGDGRLPYTPADFELSPNLVTNSDGQWWMPQAGVGGYFTRVGQVRMHPNGRTTTGGRLSIEHWAVRRWISDLSADITITGNISDYDGGDGDGIVGYILVDGANVFEQRIYDSDYTGIDYTVNAIVNVGSIVDFAVAPGPSSNDLRDMTNFTAIISPEPASLILLGLGALTLLRTRHAR